MPIKLWIFMNYVLPDLEVFLDPRHVHSQMCCFKASGRCLMIELGWRVGEGISESEPIVNACLCRAACELTKATHPLHLPS